VEDLDLRLFGKILNSNLDKRKDNPEILFINQVHDCIFELFSEDNISILSNLNKKGSINRVLKDKIISCFFLKKIHIISDPNIVYFEKKTEKYINNVLTQSDITSILAEQELLINKYRIVN